MLEGERNLWCERFRAMVLSLQRVILSVAECYIEVEPWFLSCVVVIVKKTGPDRPGRSVRPGIGSQINPIISFKLFAFKVDVKSAKIGKIGEPVRTKLVKSVDRFSFFF